MTQLADTVKEMAVPLIGLALILVSGSYLWRSMTVPYVYLACVDRFTQQAFETDRRVKQVTINDNSYSLYRNGWDLTVIPMSDNMVCEVRREYPDHLPRIASNAAD